MTFRKTLAASVFLLCLLLAALPHAEAVEDNAAEYMAKMKAALEPVQPGVRKIDIRLDEPGEQPTEWKAWQAHKHFPDAEKTVLVLVEPSDVRGVAHLIHNTKDGEYKQWVYLPFARRVRRILLEDTYQPFVGTDFTLADLGLVQLGDRSFKMLGKDIQNGTEALKIEEVPTDRMYYSKIINWIGADSMLPLRREYYTPAGLLWKKQTYDDVTIIDGVPTPLRIKMENVRSHSTTELKVTAVHYRQDIPDEVFDPNKLAVLAEHPFLVADPAQGAD